MSNFISLMSDNISMNYSVIHRNFIKHENEYEKKKQQKTKLKPEKLLSNMIEVTLLFVRNSYPTM